MNTTTLLNNRYKVIESIGRGGFGETFLAVDTHSPSGKRCVIKQLKPIINESSIPEWMYDRFEQEARILEHVGDEQNQVPRLHAYFCEDKNFYLVQEWVEGITLTKKIQQEGKMSPEEVEKFLLNILPVLGYIHRENIVHRDVKPDNIILRAKDNLPVLIDFGAVKEALTTFVYSQGQSAYSMAIGTPGYMSSEQAAGRPIYSSDLYSLGLTAVYLLTGKSPQHLRSDNRTGEILWRDEIPDLHSNLAGVIDKAIRFSPRERFSSASEMLEALKPNTSHQATMGFGSPAIPNHVPPAHTISNEPTIAVGGRYGSPNIVNNSHNGTIRRGNGGTMAVDSPTEGYEEEEKRGFFGALLPILWLSLIAIASFTLGYGVIANLFSNSNGDFANESGQNQTTETPEDVEPPTIESNRRNPILNPDIFRRPQSEEEITEEEIPPEESAENQEGDTGATDNETTSPDTIPPESSGGQNQPPTTIPPVDNNNSQGRGRGDSPPRGNSGGGNSLPVLTTGNVVNEIVGRLGQPSQRQSNPSENATIWSYDNIFNSSAQVSYKIDDSSGRVREVDLSFPTSTDMETMAATFDRLLRGNLTPVVREALRQVNDGETDLRSFSVANWNGQIRKINGRININVWVME
ncbi:serine/threonine protein kinase [Cyanobacterium stanieri PCC 7202]|uniref:non-specific serine/threonine protein kinase n=1 Tax=Cyanobacterium stanieri (strain ATCC 29140 / PCC 7202) TaxID=292563 RepID=K9YNF8_CYASC|nr:serine/threonine protein kinase [Cyanobacterium stanieri PCC 7202]